MDGVPPAHRSPISPVRSLADDLRSRADDDLVRLLTRRPDLCRPEPADLTSLAARAGTRPSVHRALELLDAAQLAVLRALAATGDPVRPDPAAALLGVAPEALAPVVDALWEAALVWQDGHGRHLPRVVTEILGGTDARPPAGWSLTAPAVSAIPRPPEAVASACGAHASVALELLDELAYRWTEDPPRALRHGGLPLRDLNQLAQAMGVTTGQAAVVVEVAWAARLVADDEEADPHWRTTSFTEDWRLLPPAARWALVIQAWYRLPRAPHLAGGRGPDGAAFGALGPGLRWPDVRRLRHLILSEVQRLQPDGANGSAGTVSRPDPVELARRVRWLCPRLDTKDVDALTTAVLAEADLLGLTDAGAPGPGLALLLRDGSADQLADRIVRWLPEPADHMLLQADLTAVVPGRVDGELGTTLRGCAEVESRGGATVFRFSEASLHRWFDSGRAPEELLDRLARLSRTPVPQPLGYLVQDVARRHGQIRAGVASCYLRSDDPALLSDLLSRRELSGLGLRRLAPTVLICSSPAAQVVRRLQAGGLRPLLEGPDGSAVATPRLEGAGRPRVSQSRPEPAAATTSNPVDLAGLVTRLRQAQAGRYEPGPVAQAAQAGRAGYAARPALANQAAQPSSDQPATRQAAGPVGPPGAPVTVPVTDPTVTLALLREAIDDGRSIWVAVADRDGHTEAVLLHPTQVASGRVLGTVEGSAQPRSFPVHRICGVADVLC